MEELDIQDSVLREVCEVTSLFLVTACNAPHKIAKGTQAKNESVFFGVGDNMGIVCMKDGKPNFIAVDNNRVRYLRMEGFSDDFINEDATGVWKEVSSINEFAQLLTRK